MSGLFRTVLNMSVTGGIAALCVLLLRFPLKRAPRWITCVLWLVVFLRLIVPVSFSSPVSLLGSVGAPAPTNGVVTYLSSEEMQAGMSTRQTVQSVTNQSVERSASLTPTPQDSADPIQIWLAVGSAVWILGICAILLSSAISYFRLSRRVRDAVFVEPGVFETDAVTSPFVMGVLHPRIILPIGMSMQARELVLLHERSHLLRLDHLVKPAVFLIASIHWFNPLAWVAFRCFCDDMEASCDERAVRSLERSEIAAYGETLLRFGTRQMRFAGGPLAFGEHCTKERIVNVLNYKKPVFWVVAFALIAAVSAAVVLLANPIVSPKQAIEPSIKEMELGQMRASDFDKATYDVPENDSSGLSWRVGVGLGLNVATVGLDISVFERKSVSAEMLADFGNQLVNGQAYIQAYLKLNAAGCYDEKIASSKVNYDITNDDTYQYYLRSQPYRIKVGKMYWHCAEYYIFMILHPESLHWQHYGYAAYLGNVLNPYNIYLAKMNREGIAFETGLYAQTYFDHGGAKTKLTNEDYRLLVDAIAYHCLTDGMNWGTPYESWPVTSIYGFTEPAEQGDDMSVIMATSFCAYLSEHYGFDRLTSYCSGQSDFYEAFGVSFDRAYARWQKSILKEFS
ncbi:MAG TPA: M56 family metallopeptidase [Clostridia bacterium]|nr:M56 family metallopeptidase [Clostridia bacterium]